MSYHILGSSYMKIQDTIIQPHIISGNLIEYNTIYEKLIHFNIYIYIDRNPATLNNLERFLSRLPIGFRLHGLCESLKGSELRSL